MNTDKAIVIFAKEPRQGRVKTRLQRNLSSASTLSFYKAFVRDVIAMVQKTPNTHPIIFYSGNTRAMPFLNQFSKRIQLCKQRGKKLGDRMHNAFVRCQKMSFQKTLIIGTDCLSISSKDLINAFKKLEDHDCVLGPSRDGGYYLIGLKTADEKIFQNVEWSSSKVFAQTCTNLKKAGKTYFPLDPKDDIDEIANLIALEKNKRLRSKLTHTDRVFRKISQLGMT